jgi:hypothetical protein
MWLEDEEVDRSVSSRRSTDSRLIALGERPVGSVELELEIEPVISVTSGLEFGFLVLMGP